MPKCNSREFKSRQSHELLREKLRDQPEWKRNIVLASWAAMSDVNDEYLRKTEMPMCLRALLGTEKTVDASNVHHKLEKIESAFWSRRDNPNAAEAWRLAGAALGRKAAPPNSA